MPFQSSFLKLSRFGTTMLSIVEIEGGFFQSSFLKLSRFGGILGITQPNAPTDFQSSFLKLSRFGFFKVKWEIECDSLSIFFSEA